VGERERGAERVGEILWVGVCASERGSVTESD
jgi:hypothetical protein